MRKTYDSKFKSRVVLEAMRGELTIAEIASKYQVHPNQGQSWWLPRKFSATLFELINHSPSKSCTKFLA
ncbi:MAG: transposase [Lentisphaeria bacterium]|nr:transposase [Lentisphaeria bacterium]